MRTTRVLISAAAAVMFVGAMGVTAQASLTHNYDFAGSTGNTDTVGGTSGTLENGATLVSGTGVVLSNGGLGAGNTGSNPATAQYDSLGSNLLPTNGSATIEEYFQPASSASGGYSQEFDFNNGPGSNSGATSSDYLLGVASYPNNGGFSSHIALNTGSGETDSSPAGYIDAPGGAGGANVMVAAVIDGTNNTLSYYLNGTLVGTPTAIPAGTSLAVFNNVNTWLGISPFASDPALNATLQSFRIFNNPLTASQIAADNAAGPNGPISESPAIPEPATLGLLGVGAVGMLARRKRKTA